MYKEAKSTSTTTSNEPPGHDIFCTPENSEFLLKVHYKDLNASDREIRLLKILPESRSGFVECELLPSAKLADVHKQYLALSYCAGDARKTKPIIVNGARCNVFANLQHALTTRGLIKLVSCEPFMRVRVRLLFVYLSLRHEETGCDGLRNWNDSLEMGWFTKRCFPQKTGHVPEVSTQIIGFKFKMQRCLSQPEFVDGWIEFCEALSSPWWGRAWVFQEFMVSSRATFLYGQHSMDHALMLILMPDLCLSTLGILFEPTKTRGTCVKKKLKRAKVTRTQVSRSVSKILSVFLAKHEWYRNYVLKKLLVYTQNSQSSDERDRIYSTVGLAHPGYAIIPDYLSENGFERLLV
ncbi:hypothetical protein FOXG_13667 [Fusarium oxysporum f. sp. lycopersici 4287]|uniref:Heterokaryon incompatibility domain-containing protein n=3 Tax=Fusarium oxysporum TaxID=5507 RepID=A0A0J9VVC5_FUSO4|nr:hypothetical protein FOXG_13667 [Fusarium oxysporum f. sp. lycopersici 4287]EXK34676.1 hypothetical protein FOMG_10052 [Fusarium oxysporum f. sp. melonis 26406]KNB14919.1 hypothetical protein FOXG_13667 [Fusarium oxysporum f. sp. lycopersici 4287]